MENSIKNQLEESRKDGTLKEMRIKSMTQRR